MIEHREAEERLKTWQARALVWQHHFAPSLPFLHLPAITCAFDYNICTHAFSAALVVSIRVHRAFLPLVPTVHRFCFCCAIVGVNSASSGRCDCHASFLLVDRWRVPPVERTLGGHGDMKEAYQGERKATNTWRSGWSATGTCLWMSIPACCNSQELDTLLPHLTTWRCKVSRRSPATDGSSPRACRRYRKLFSLPVAVTDSRPV
jgi:hypothetical protein